MKDNGKEEYLTEEESFIMKEENIMKGILKTVKDKVMGFTKQESTNIKEIGIKDTWPLTEL